MGASNIVWGTNNSTSWVTWFSPVLQVSG